MRKNMALIFALILALILSCVPAGFATNFAASSICLPLTENDSINPFLYGQLFHVDVQQPKPVQAYMARSWDYDNQANTLTIKLRDDWFWQDGTPVTSRDLQASLYRQFSNDTLLVEYIIDATTPDDHTFVVRFSASATPLLPICLGLTVSTQHSGWMEEMLQIEEWMALRKLDEQKHYYLIYDNLLEQLAAIAPPERNAPANGAYYIAKENDKTVSLYKNDNFPYALRYSIEQIELLKCDLQSVYQLAKDGNLDLEWLSLTPEDTGDLKNGAKEVTTIWTNQSTQPLLILNKEIPQAVRQSIFSSIDWDSMLLEAPTGVLGGDPYCSGLPSSWLHQITDDEFLGSLKRYDYVVENGIDIMAEHGYKKNSSGYYQDEQENEIEIVLHIEDTAVEYKDSMQIVVESLNNAGFKTRLGSSQECNASLVLIDCNTAHSPTYMYAKLNEMGILPDVDVLVWRRFCTAQNAEEYNKLLQRIMASLNEKALFTQIATAYAPLRLHNSKYTLTLPQDKPMLNELSGTALLAQLIPAGGLQSADLE